MRRSCAPDPAGSAPAIGVARESHRGALDQTEAVGGRAMDGEEVSVVGLVSRIGGQAVLLGRQWVNDPCFKLS